MQKVELSPFLKFEPRDLWIGAYWDYNRYASDDWELKIYICIIPMLPFGVVIDRFPSPYPPPKFRKGQLVRFKPLCKQGEEILSVIARRQWFESIGWCYWMPGDFAWHGEKSLSRCQSNQ